MSASRVVSTPFGNPNQVRFPVSMSAAWLLALRTIPLEVRRFPGVGSILISHNTAHQLILILIVSVSFTAVIELSDNASSAHCTFDAEENAPYIDGFIMR